MDKRAWILFGAATVAILAGLVFFSRQEKLDLSNVDATKIITEDKVEETGSGLPDNIIGNKGSKVVLVEYGDYSCDGCAALDGRLKPVVDEFKDDIAFVYRHFPITSIHPNSLLASTYVEAAGFQGKYWQLHETLFKNYDSWRWLGTDSRDQKLQEYAQSVGLDMDKLKEDLGDQRIKKKVDFDQQLGKSIGVNATPTLFLNGEKLGDEVSDMTKMRETLEKAIKDAK